jgi:hypothetical protein|tara:strand:- start:2384 stop:2644 length:261 start_codon:yes stop_codon:yes gene_type:complete
MSFKPQQMLVEEKGLENQIKRLKDLVPTESSKEYPLGYLKEQLTTIIEDLEDIKLSIKSENDRILKHSFKETAKAVNFDEVFLGKK